MKIIAKTYAADRQCVGGWVPYSEGVHDDINRFACLRHAANPSTSALETALAYARQWLHLDGGTAHEVATVLLGLGWIDRPKRIYVDPGRGLLDPETDRRLNILCRARHTNPQLHDNYRYWLIYYRALCEAFCVVDGELPLDWLNQEVSICREALKNTEPSYARHLSSVHPNELPGVTAWCWPRSFKHYWSREMDYESPSENAIRGTSVI